VLETLTDRLVRRNRELAEATQAAAEQEAAAGATGEQQ